MDVFVVRADYGKYTESFLKNNYVGIGWLWEKLEDYKSREQIEEKYHKLFPEHASRTAYQNIAQLNRFLNEINMGDIVITPYNDGNLLLGEISGEPFFISEDNTDFCYGRKVKWFKKKINRKNYSIPLQNTLRSSLTVFRVSQIAEVLESMGLKTPEVKKEITVKYDTVYSTIKEKLLELSSEEFELLVGYLLQTLGFEATRSTGGPNDGGIDYEGVLNVMGLAAVNLQVQVKRYESSSIHQSLINSFRGSMKRDFQGTFVTLSSFSKKAIETAEDPERVPINLIDGNKLIDIFIEQYDKLMDIIQSEDDKILAEKLKFKKALLPG